MPIEITSPNEEMAELFARKGLETLWISRADPDEPAEVVFPFGKEHRLFELLKELGPEVVKAFGTKVIPRTILYHLALERFGGISPSLRLSTTIRNLENPKRVRLSKSKKTRLAYDVVIAAIDVPAEVRADVSKQIANAAGIFNVVSKYMKIGSLGVAFVPTRLLSGPVTGFKAVEIPTPPLSL